jgi:hypothetical protein
MDLLVFRINLRNGDFILFAKLAKQVVGFGMVLNHPARKLPNLSTLRFLIGKLREFHLSVSAKRRLDNKHPISLVWLMRRRHAVRLLFCTRGDKARIAD